MAIKVTMSNKCAMFLVVVAVLVTLSDCKTGDLPTEKLIKNYLKINKYLDKNVQSNDPVINMAKATDLLNEKASRSTLFTGRSLIDSLKLLTEFSDLSSNLCDKQRARELMEKIDSGLADDLKMRTPNYPLSRVERIIEHFAFEKTLRCGFVKDWPQLIFGYKQLAYDNINSRLIDEVPEMCDIESNMVKAEELLKGLNSPNGALAEALKQLLTLKSTLHEDTCNDIGYKILLRNDLATRGKNHRYSDIPSRRIDKIFQYFATKHEELCRPIIRQSLGSELKMLDQDTYRYVLGFTSFQLLQRNQIAEMVESVNGKGVDENFSVPVVDKFFKDTLRNSFFASGKVLVVSSFEIFDYVRAISTNDPNARSLLPVADKNSGIKAVDEDKIKGLINKYLLNPCNRYLRVFEELINADDYSSNMNKRHFLRRYEKFTRDTTYYMVRAGYQICKQVYSMREEIYKEVFKANIESPPSEETKNLTFALRHLQFL